MKFTIELNAYEVKEAVKSGLLAGLAALEVQDPEPEQQMPAQEITPIPQQTPGKQAEVVPQQQIQPQQQPAVPLQTVPTQPVDAAAQQVVAQPDPQAQQPVPQAGVPTQTVTYTQEQLALAASQLMEAKKDSAVVINLLSQFGVQALTQLPQEQYGAFASKLRSLGAKI